MKDFDTALIIREPWIELILSGQKTWEMHYRYIKIRGRIGLIKQGTGLVVGSATIHDCLTRKSFDQLIINFDKHQVPYDGKWDTYKKWRFPLVLKDVIRFSHPIKYDHKQGAQSWIKV